MPANTTTLTPEQREAIYHAWIAALRSGQYKQGRIYLEADGKFCCLGVLCHVLHQRPELGIEMNRFVTPDGTAVYSTPASPGFRNRAPCSSESELGLSTKMPSAEHRSVEAVLVDLNDGNGASFAEIAQLIEDAVMPLLRAKGVLPSTPAAQQPTEGEEIMVNTPHGVFTLPLHPSGLSSGPRFVVHVPELQRESVTVRYDLSPAQTESAIRDALIRMGWTPPEGESVATVKAERAAMLAAQQPAHVDGAIDKARFERAPCYMCGYNGPGYYQPDTHPCAAKYHAAQQGDER